ncbi:SusD/RagB family nutrient-binding outer membrane lipoprotein [Roseivirga sp. BDSF3-8]|uniref:SusD/RagB family nutrient-binding outer membrane lipoprotein n=1 Tax=Roseivirga sp. BDSF3-8 TaxID=3241598 RepID=UPI0035320586
MNIGTYISRIGALALLLLPLAGCDDYLDINENPNSPTTAELPLLLPVAESTLGFRMARTINENTSVFARQYYALAPSQYTQSPQSYNADFTGLMSGALKDLQVIIDQGTAEENYGYVGMAKVMKAYTYGVMVDLWGDLPFVQALQGDDGLFFPEYDDAADIYTNLFALLDEGIADLERESPAVLNDLIYGGDKVLWIKAANSIKLRLYLNLRLVDPGGAAAGINGIIGSDAYITDNDEDFQFQFGTSIAPITRHPLHQQEYAGQASKGFYMSNYFMYKLITKEDPRLPFYVYRQSDGSALDFQTTPCSQRSDCPYGYLGTFIGPEAAGYVGRDHGDPSGIPGDGNLRATFGVYPIGGLYDDGDYDEALQSSNGGMGAGIMPMMTNFMGDFILAEAALTLNVNGDPLDYLLEGVEASLRKVSALGVALDSDAEPISEEAMETYLQAVSIRYGEATSDAGRLNVIIEEKYFAQFGNGMEVYTDLRRTGMPNDLPASIAPAAPFPLRLPYPSTEINSNSGNVEQPPLTTPIFWDAN